MKPENVFIVLFDDLVGIDIYTKSHGSIWNEMRARLSPYSGLASLEATGHKNKRFDQTQEKKHKS